MDLAHQVAPEVAFAQRAERAGFGDAVRRPEAQAPATCLGAARSQGGGHQNARCRLRLQQQWQRGQPVHPGHFHIQHHHVHRCASQRIHRLLPIACTRNDADRRIAFEDAADRPPDQGRSTPGLATAPDLPRSHCPSLRELAEQDLGVEGLHNVFLGARRDGLGDVLHLRLGGAEHDDRLVGAELRPQCR